MDTTKHIFVKRRAKFQDEKGKKSASHQPANVGDICHMSGVSEKQLKKFVSDPNRQQYDRRNFQVVKIKPQ
jgi:hypothetical protein